MKITPEHRRAFEKNAQPVFVVNQIGVGSMIGAVAVGVAIGIFSLYIILAVLGTTL